MRVQAVGFRVYGLGPRLELVACARQPVATRILGVLVIDAILFALDVQACSEFGTCAAKASPEPNTPKP